ncbi:uncharacterized protein LOC111620312 [Centruroides sculpturatus]|uniref:uncharacterized protein LOC111620312 n=1 Tax=Centruroides sculpturatus TaxID=218467 RepID=UPI000C6CDD91|nr:uncharacterized protein LOC111620312 [Centruroides sculpturatus]
MVETDPLFLDKREPISVIMAESRDFEIELNVKSKIKSKFDARKVKPVGVGVIFSKGNCYNSDQRPREKFHSYNVLRRIFLHTNNNHNQQTHRLRILVTILTQHLYSNKRKLAVIMI